MEKSRAGLITVDWGKLCPSQLSVGMVGFNYTPQVSSCWAMAEEDLLKDAYSRPRTYGTVVPSTSQSSEYIRWTNRGRSEINDCYHVKRSGYFYYAYGCAYVGSPVPNWRWVLPAWREKYFNVPNVGVLASPVLTAVPDSVKARAWATMLPRFEGPTQMLNMLWELKDFRNICQEMALLFSGNRWFAEELKRIAALDAPLPKRYRRVTARPDKDVGHVIDGAVDMLSGLWLTNALALQPLLMDLNALQLAMRQTATDALAEFKKQGLLPNKRHYTEVISGTLDLISQPLYTQPWYYPTWYYDRRTTYTATMDYRYQYADISRMEAAARYWGFTGGVSALWNASMLTFIVDYVVGIGQALKTAESDENLALTPISFCESVRAETSVVGVFNSLQASKLCALHVDGRLINLADCGYEPIKGLRNTVYDRKLSKPRPGLIVPRLKWPKTPQLLNVAAIAKMVLF